MSDYEVAELTWQDGRLSAHGHMKGTPKYTPPTSAAGTLESLVDQAKLLHPITASRGPANHRIPAAIDPNRGQREGLAPSGIGSCDDGDRGWKRGGAHDHTSTATSSTGSLSDGNGAVGSPDTENTSLGGGGCGSMPTTAADDHDSVCHSRPRSMSQRETGEDEEKVTEGGTVRSTISTKRSRTAAVHNQSERKRRDRINQKMRTLQKLVPNSKETDKASVLDEVIQYMKQLQAQVAMMSRMSSMPPMMTPIGMPPQFLMTMMAQMAQMAQMGMGMGMGMMDLSSLGRTGPSGISPAVPVPAFLPVVGAASWDPSAAAVMSDPFSSFVACPAQPQIPLDAYQRMVVLCQQMFQQTQQATNPK